MIKPGLKKCSFINLILGLVSVPAFIYIMFRFLGSSRSYFRSSRIENIFGYSLIIVYMVIVFLINRTIYIRMKEDANIQEYLFTESFLFLIPWIIVVAFYYSYVN